MVRSPLPLPLPLALTLLLLSSSAEAQEGAEDPGAESVPQRSVLRAPGSLFDRSTHRRTAEAAFFLEQPYGYVDFGGGGTARYGLPALGLGARLYFPLVNDGFAPTLNDEFGVEAGVDLMLRFNVAFYPLIDIPVAALWRLHVTPQVNVYAKAGLGLGLGNRFDAPVYLVGELLVGVGLRITDTVGLRFEAGYPGVRLGLSLVL